MIFGITENADGSAKAVGVNRKAAESIKGNFVNMLNNPNKIHPSLFLQLEEFEYDDALLLWVYIPVSSQVEFCGKEIFDRNQDKDIAVTHSQDLVANLYNRKSHTFFENSILPYLQEDDLDLSLVEKAKQLALARDPNSSWKTMSAHDILYHTGLYDKNYLSGEQGFNLAAVLLFGKDATIRSCLPAYMINAIYQKNDVDRYDDRLVINTNLIDSYDLLMNFIAKHTDDRFALVDNVNTSVRNIIAREVVSNLLVHREYGSAFIAKLQITPDLLYTENWSRSLIPGKLDPNHFSPYPKNPLLAKFFMQIGRAEETGSGVRNLYKFSKIYSGKEPELIEGDVFRTYIPLGSNVAVNITALTDRQQIILNMIRNNSDVTSEEIMQETGISRRTLVREIGEIRKAGANIIYDKGENKWIERL